MKNETIKEEFTDKGLREAKDKLDVMKLPEKDRKAYQAYVATLHDKASYELTVLHDYNRGVEKGKENGLKEALDRMVAAGIPEAKAKEISGIK